MIEVLVKEYRDGTFIVATKNKSIVVLKKEFEDLIETDVMQKYVFSLMKTIPETPDEYVELSWIINRRVNMKDDPKVFFLSD